MNRRVLFYLSSCIMALVGCSSTPQRVSIGFLEHAPVTREQVAAQLGPASASFEGDRVLTYRLRQYKTDYYVVPPTNRRGWEGVNYDLVLAFDDAGVLSQHRMVPIRLPESPR